jgi:hypothetical protein
MEFSFLVQLTFPNFAQFKIGRYNETVEVEPMFSIITYTSDGSFII